MYVTFVFVHSKGDSSAPCSGARQFGTELWIGFGPAPNGVPEQGFGDVTFPPPKIYRIE